MAAIRPCWTLSSFTATVALGTGSKESIRVAKECRWSDVQIMSEPTGADRNCHYRMGFNTAVKRGTLSPTLKGRLHLEAWFNHRMPPDSER